MGSCRNGFINVVIGVDTSLYYLEFAVVTFNLFDISSVKDSSLLKGDIGLLGVKTDAPLFLGEKTLAVVNLLLGTTDTDRRAPLTNTSVGTTHTWRILDVSWGCWGFWRSRGPRRS